MSTITIKPTITVELPAGQVIVSEDYLARLEAADDTRRWWTMTDVIERYGHDRKWYVRNVFAPYEKDLYDRIVIYPHGGGTYYQIRPVEFARFMDTHFGQIARRARS